MAPRKKKTAPAEAEGPAPEAKPKRTRAAKAPASDAPPGATAEAPAGSARTAPGEPAAPAAAAAPAASGSAEAPKLAPERVVFPPDVYGARKDEIKAPLKDLGLKWQYLGTGKGIYRGEGLNVFYQYSDDVGADYTVRGTDRAAADRLLAAWRAILGAGGLAEAKEKGAEVAAVEQQAAESEATRLWKLGEPQRRAGEPEGFYKRRVAEWMAKKPSA